MKISVIIPGYRANTIGYAIASIQKQTHLDWELFVVGQGENPSLKTVMEEFQTVDRRIHYLHIPKNGASRARNEGIYHSEGELIVMIDDDCEADPQLLKTYIELFEQHPEIGLAGGGMTAPLVKERRLGICPQTCPSEAIYDPKATRKTPPSGWDLVGGNLACRAETFRKIGGFDPYLGPGTEFPAAEDTDYKLRLENEGVAMASTPRAKVEHTHGFRYGFRAIAKSAWNYAYGNAGLAGKLTLLGDPRGQEWMQATRRQCLDDMIKRPKRILPALYRWKNSADGYKKCLKCYRTEKGLLVPVLQ